MNLPITKNGSQISSFNVPDDLTIVSELMGAKEINASLELPGVLTAPIGSQINYKGGVYTINTIPGPQKINNYKYRYDLRFESKEYRLYDKGLKHPTTKNKAFQYYGDLTDYAQLIVGNINQIDSGWTVGICDVLPSKPINFTGQTCRAALDMIAEAFSVEWEVDGQQIRFVKQVGNVTTLIFQYGRGKGLYTLGYKYQEDKNIVTRATGYGSTRNLPENYRNGATQLMFDGEHLDKNIFLADGMTQLYGIKEGDFEDQDIFPEIAGVVSGVSAYDSESNRFTITDSSLTFNLNDYWSTMDPKLSFKSGELQGQEFKITKYDNATKTITLEVFQDGQGNNLPNATFQAAIGDTYTLFDMHLPTEIVKAAEDRLQAATQSWLNENCVPRVLYSLEMDPLYARDNGIYLKPGDKVRIIDVDLGIDEFIRVTKTEYNLNFPEVITQNTKISCEIANFIPHTITERVISNTIDNKKDIKVVDKTSSEKARINSLNMKTLSGRIFDPDGNLAKGAETLFAGMLQVGFESQNFTLTDVTISPKADNDPNKMVISGGQLVHLFYSIEGLGYKWTMSPATFSGLNPAKFYYVYAKCSKTALAGTWGISETPVFVNDYPGYWVFNLGQLYEVNSDGYRNFEFTKGMTYIVGDQITTGRIKSIDGINYIDLGTSDVNFGSGDHGWDINVTAPGTFTIREALASKIIQVGSGGLVNSGISGITDAGASSIRFWAGSDVAGKSTAPFRVQDDGKMFSTAGKIANFNIEGNGLVNDNGNAFVAVKSVSGSNAIGGSIGAGLPTTFWGNFAKAVSVLTNTIPDTESPNLGLVIDVANGPTNVAIQVLRGSVNLSKTARMVVEDQDGNIKTGLDVVEDVRVGGDQFRRMTWVNGVLVSSV